MGALGEGVARAAGGELGGGSGQERDPLLGRVVDGFVLRRVLGRGGQCTVYQADHADHGERVALKVIGPAALADPELRALFEGEYALMRRVHHPNVVRARSSGLLPGGAPFLVLACVEGEPIGRRHRARAVLWELLLQTCDALAAVHAAGIIHRDVKPENVLVEEGPRGPQVRLLDFGAARLFSAPICFGPGGRRVFGTPPYMAPEQGLPWEDARADQYAFAVTAYRLLTGKLPPGGARPGVGAPPPLPLHELRADVPEEVSAVIHRAMAIQPADRFPDMKTLREALGAALSRTRTQTASRPPPLPRRARAKTLPVPKPLLPPLEARAAASPAGLPTNAPPLPRRSRRLTPQPPRTFSRSAGGLSPPT